MKKYIWLLIGLMVPTTSFAGFPDVPSSHSNAQAINFVKSQGIVGGYPDGTFQPKRGINRAEFTKIMIETAFSEPEINACNTDLIGLSDIQSSDWFAKYVCIAKEQDIVGGYPDGTFKAANNVSYAEASKIVAETLQLPLGPGGDQWFDTYVQALEQASAQPRNNIKPVDSLNRGEMAQIIYNIQSTTTTPPEKVEAPETPEPTKEPQYLSYTDGRYQQLKADKHAFVINLSASWCPVCQALDRNIKKNLSSYPGDTVILNADYDEEKDLKAEFGITRQTSGILFDTDGNTSVRNGTLNEQSIIDFFANN